MMLQLNGTIKPRPSGVNSPMHPSSNQHGSSAAVIARTLSISAEGVERIPLRVVAEGSICFNTEAIVAKILDLGCKAIVNNATQSIVKKKCYNNSVGK